jgi:hypothetical protein
VFHCVISQALALTLALMPCALQAAPRAAKKPAVLAIQTGKQYRDYYGTTITHQATLLKATDKTYRWGVTNAKPQEMAYFSGTLLSGAKHNQRFTASLYIDSAIKAPMVFAFKVGDRNGETLESVTVKPGETVHVDVKLWNQDRVLRLGAEDPARQSHPHHPGRTSVRIGLEANT